MSEKRYTIGEINQLSLEDFTRVVGPVFENSPWIAQQTSSVRPFANPDALYRALCATVSNAHESRKIDLIRAHPDLVGRAALAGALTNESAKEQASAGLDRLTTDEIVLFQKYNSEYRTTFGFPFVICARLNKKEAILAGFEKRLKNSREQEIQTALQEIFKIAELRLRDLITTQAVTNKLSTHVLDTANGCPAAGMQIELWFVSGADRHFIKTVRTNNDGRTDGPLLSGDELKEGQYELLFFVGDYFAKKMSSATPVKFLDQVPIRFGIADGSAAYHVPLLCSPWAYSTYRGS